MTQEDRSAIAVLAATEAIGLINELVDAEVQLVKQENNGPGGATKSAMQRERNAVVRLFRALTGESPTMEQITEMVSL